MATEFGKRLKLVRERAGFTQPQLAAMVPMAQSTLASAEAGGDGSRLTAQLAHHCGVDAYWLATGEGAMLAAATPASTQQVPLRLEDALPVVLGALARVPESLRQELLDTLSMCVRYGKPHDAQRLAELLAPAAGTAAALLAKAATVESAALRPAPAPK